MTARIFGIAPSTRLRPSPYFEATRAEGVTSFTVYNRMLMPTGYGDPEGEYWRLINGVALWDVACERQVELRGPDAGRLAQILAARDLGKCAQGQGRYVALCDHAGTLINDPILLKLADDRFWLSIADSNILLWARAIADERRLNVTVSEPDVSPMAVQGPKAEDVAAAVFGDWVRGLRRFQFRHAAVEGIPVVVARSGWSKQGGFEFYLMDGSKGSQLWSIVREAGRPWEIGPGNPNHCERVEGGLLSYGGDTDDATNPFEVRLGRYVDLDVPDEVIGIAALRRIHAEGPRRHQLGVVLDGAAPVEPGFTWANIRQGGRKVGDMTTCVWSFRLRRNIGFALVARACAAGEDVEVVMGGRAVSGRLVDLPFVR
ncbi:MAG: glycine cleavage system protein T [Alphaproteobacteria bacterium]|nr:glycine cleavage system protein T [Alphaproteobacteria bacterium]